MKKTILFFAMLLSAIVASAKDIKTVVFTTNPIMHCESCEKKIKGNLRFEKGVKSIETNVAEQRVTVSYDAAKTDAAKLQKAFSKFGYEATVVGCDRLPLAAARRKHPAAARRKPLAVARNKRQWFMRAVKKSCSQHFSHLQSTS